MEDFSGGITKIIVSIVIVCVLQGLGVNRWIAQGIGESFGLMMENAKGKTSAELKRINEEREFRANVWKSQMKQLAKSKKRIRLKLENDTHKKIYVAAHYLDLAGNWVTGGWWSIDAFDSMSPNIYTDNRTIYFYAYSEDNKWIWDGKGENGSINKFVSYRNKFSRLIASDKLEGLEDVRRVPFFKQKMNGWSFTQTFN